MHVSPAAIVELVDLALTIPATTNSEGLPTIARRWRCSAEAIALADALAAWVAADEAGATRPPTPIAAPELDEITRHRIRRYVHAVGFDLRTGRERAASSIARFLTLELRLADEVGLSVLSTWNAGNQPPIPDYQLRDLYEAATMRTPTGRAS